MRLAGGWPSTNLQNTASSIQAKESSFGRIQALKYLYFLLFKAIMPKNKHKELEPQTMSSPKSF